MLIKRKKGWEIPERLATPESIYLNRRQILAAGGFGLAGGGCCRGVAARRRPTRPPISIRRRATASTRSTGR